MATSRSPAGKWTWRTCAGPSPSTLRHVSTGWATAHPSDRTAAHNGSLRRDRGALDSGIVPWPTSQGPVPSGSPRPVRVKRFVERPRWSSSSRTAGVLRRSHLQDVEGQEPSPPRSPISARDPVETPRHRCGGLRGGHDRLGVRRPCLPRRWAASGAGCGFRVPQEQPLAAGDGSRRRNRSFEGGQRDRVRRGQHLGRLPRIRIP
jgi:hypothetical protein